MLPKWLPKISLWMAKGLYWRWPSHALCQLRIVLAPRGSAFITAIVMSALDITGRRMSGRFVDSEKTEAILWEQALLKGLAIQYQAICVSEYCVGKPCVVCRKTIQSANYYCPRCKACICFYCGAEMLREAGTSYLKCPRCGTKLKWKPGLSDSSVFCV